MEGARVSLDRDRASLELLLVIRKGELIFLLYYLLLFHGAYILFESTCFLFAL